MVQTFLLGFPAGECHRLHRLLHLSGCSALVCDELWLRGCAQYTGHVAGLGRWDAMTGLHVFHGLYGKNANVFAAVPSLHAAYMFLTTIYAVMSRKRWYTVVLFACICLGIWWTAVYSGHHYIIDVMLGILTTIAGVLLMESKRIWARLRETRNLRQG